MDKSYATFAGSKRNTDRVFYALALVLMSAVCVLVIGLMTL